MKTENTTTKAPAITGEKKAPAAMPEKARYAIVTVTLRDLAAIVDNLPPMQTVRGSVWPADRQEKLVADYLAGLYVPPITLGGVKPNADGAIPAGAKLLLLDGQQRVLALLAAARAGLVSWDATISAAVDMGRTAEECFTALNIGVAVPKALVRAQGYKPIAREGVLRIAATIKEAGLGWTATQCRNSQHVSHAAAATAICAGWDVPESSAARVAAWIDASGKVNAAAIAKAERVVNAVLVAYADYTAKATKAKARGADSIIRTTAKWQTIVGYVASVPAGQYAAAADDAIYCYNDDAAVSHAPTDDEGHAVGKSLADIAGGGSSGGPAEYADRLRAMRGAIAWYHSPAYAPATAVVTAAPDAAVAQAEQVLAAAVAAGVRGGN